MKTLEPMRNPPPSSGETDEGGCCGCLFVILAFIGLITVIGWAMQHIHIH